MDSAKRLGVNRIATNSRASFKVGDDRIRNYYSHDLFRYCLAQLFLKGKKKFVYGKMRLDAYIHSVNAVVKFPIKAVWSIVL